MKYNYSIFLIVYVFFSFALFSQENSESTPILPDQETGFIKGKLYLNARIGMGLSAPNGSFVRHEKLFDETTRLLVANKELRYVEPFGAYPPMSQSGSYESGGFFGIGFEYGISPSIGIGSSFSMTNVWSRRLETIRDPRDAKLYLIPSEPPEELQLALMATLFDLRYHIFSKSKFDPFFSLYIGPVFASGIAHHGFTKEIDRPDENIHNGRGLAYGSSIGVNFHINQRMGIRPEISYMRYDFQADEFGSRSYFNVFFNLSVFARFSN